MKSIISLLCVSLLAFVQHVQGIYFYLEPGQEKCFKDEVVKNYVSNHLNF
jgi:hypothetical protein